MEPSQSDNMDTDGLAPFTKAERIQQLNNIDRSLNQLLTSAAHAVKTLSATQTADALPNPDRRQQFEANCNSYLRTLQTVDVELHRQIYGLEESNIIPADKTKKEKPIENHSKSISASRLLSAKDPLLGNDGIGKSDIGLLNSQNGRVGRRMEAELWKKTRSLLEKVESEYFADTLSTPEI